MRDEERLEILSLKNESSFVLSSIVLRNEGYNLVAYKP